MYYPVACIPTHVVYIEGAREACGGGSESGVMECSHIDCMPVNKKVIYGIIMVQFC